MTEIPNEQDRSSWLPVFARLPGAGFQGLGGGPVLFLLGPTLSWAAGSFLLLRVVS